MLLVLVLLFALFTLGPMIGIRSAEETFVSSRRQHLLIS